MLTTIDLAALTAAQGTTIFGADANDLSGFSVSNAGDVNGDGFDDLLIGARSADAFGNAKSDAGESYVIFGGPSLPTTIDLANLGTAGITIFGVNVDDRSGVSVSSAGDVNGDGFDDLLIGASDANATGSGRFRSPLGGSYVIFGGASLPATIDLATLGAAGVTIFGAGADDRSGNSVRSAGDVNGDGFDDLVIGATGGDAAGNAKSGAGETYVIFGGPSLPAMIDLANLGTAGITIFGAEAGDSSGTSVSSAGDVNGDGFDDLLIGAWGGDASGNAKLGAGESYVIFGGASLPTTIDLANLGTAGVTILGADAFDNSGTSVSSAGDVNGDGFDDLLIGANRADASANAKSSAGESYLIFGGPSLPGTIDLANLGTAGITIFGADVDDVSGISVSSAGDVNGDGFDDLLIGATVGDASGNAKSGSGDSYVIFGGASLPATIDLANLGSAGITIFGADVDDRSGSSVSSAGDVNGDGFVDLLIGAYRADASANAKSSAGDSYVIFGGDFTTAVTHRGTAAAETLTGTASANVMVGDRGNDTLAGNGGADVLIGGQGNDILAVSDLNFSRIVGGTGTDTLRLDGSGLHLNLTTLADNRILGVEQIDLTGSGNNRLSLNLREVLNISDESNTLVVNGNSGDQVLLDGGWTRGSVEVIGSTTYRVLTKGEATLKVGNAISLLTPSTIDLAALTAAQGTMIFGADEFDVSGGSVSSAGDVNGDGFDDLLIGAYLADASGNAKSDAGETYVIFGGPSLPATIDLANLGTAGITIFGAGSGDNGGRSVSSAGDVNGDGFDDLLIGAIGGDAAGNGKSNAGNSYVIFGGASLPQAIDLATLGAAGVTIFGADTGDRSGRSVSSAGDVNGDGFDDLLIGANIADAAENAKSSAGDSYVIFGGASLPQTIDLATLGAAGVTIFGADAGDRSGRSVSSAGDVNGDGFDDLLIGANLADGSANAKSNAGESYVIFGGPSLPTTIDLANLGNVGITIFGADAHDDSGVSVSSAGDVNGDGFDDLLIGAQWAYASGNTQTRAGESYVIFGGPSLPATIDLASLGTVGITIFGADVNDYSGVSVSSAGDVNGDGFDDLLIGASNAAASGNARFRAGESYVIFGGPSLPTTIDLANIGTAGITIFGAEALDYSGRSVSNAGDVNGDGFDDLLIGAYTADASANAKSSAGDSYLIFGGDFTAAVTHRGTAAAETLTGTASANVMVGDRGNDTLVGNGGADVLIGGQGNDILAVSDLNFSRIVGGTGTDTLRLDGSGLHLNLTTLADNRILGVEQIDLTGSGNNRLSLNLREVLNISDESNTLVVNGNSGDQVLLDGGWTRGSDEVIGSTTYRVLRNGAATLKVANAISLLTPSTIDLAALTAGQGTTIFGADSGDRSGWSVSNAGDVNGDGFDDLLVGAIFAAALENAKRSAGETYVIFGGPSLPATLDLANLGTAGITIFGAEADDNSGISVSSAGDVNGDGFDDLLIGASGADGSGNATTSAGETYVIFGGPSLPSTIDLASLGTAGMTLFGVDIFDQSGRSLSSAGDVNGDGFDDVLIGVRAARALGNTKFDAGESYLIFGGASLPTSIELASLGAAGITIFGADLRDQSGRSVSSAGDLNGDGFDDLFIGANRAGASGNAKKYAGESYVIFGRPSLPSTIDLAAPETAGLTIFGAETDDYSGYSVSSAGDVNGDGFDDLLIGAHNADASGNTKNRAGDSYVIFGGPTLPTTIDLANLGSAGITIFGADEGDRSGRSVSSAGDVNGDGFDDLLIGAHSAFASGNAKRYAGESYVIFGGPSLPSTIDLANLGSAGLAIFGVDANDNSGRSVSNAGDVNGDGFDDLLIGAYRAAGAANAAYSAGDSYLIFGGDFTTAVTHRGTAAAETLTGTASANVMVGDRGNDTLAGNGGADVLIGGQGNDILAVSDLNFSRIVGGTGTDTLRLDGSGLHLNLTTLADNRILGVEQIDLTGSGDNTLTLNLREVQNISDESNTLVVRRNLGDAVNIGSGWTQGANETIGAVTFEVYTQGAATVKLQSVAVLDTTAPTATIRSLPLTTTTSTIALIVDTNDPAGASGEPVSGVASYDVYVAMDSGPWTLLASNVPATESIVNFTAASNHRYWFRAVAKDHAGNVEPTTGGAEASTLTTDVEGPNTAVVSATVDANGLFTLNLQGSDVGGSRVQRFRVFVKVDNNAAVEIPQTNVSAGTANGSGVHSATTNYQGLRDGVAHTYTFFTRGVDSVGNLEAAPTAADADVRQTHTFAAPAALAAMDIDVQNGQTQRSYVRNVDVLFNNTSGLQSLIDNNRIRVERFDLLNATPTAGTGTLVNIAGATVNGNSIKLDFGADGLGGVGRAGNGFYRILVDTDGDGTFNDAHFEFFRLFGDSNGDGKITSADGTPTEDLNGDGLVNATDRTLWRRETSFALLDSLFALLDD